MAAARGSRGAGLRATPAVLRDSTGPLAEAEEQEWRQEETERSGGATRRALDGKTRGATLIEQDGAARTTGSGLGQGRAGARAGTEVRETRGRPRGRDRHHRFRRRLQESLNIMRNSGFQSGQGGQTAVRPDGGGTPHGTWPSPKTERVRRLRTNTSARPRARRVQRENTPTQEREGPGANKREFAECCVSRFPG